MLPSLHGEITELTSSGFDLYEWMTKVEWKLKVVERHSLWVMDTQYLKFTFSVTGGFVDTKKNETQMEALIMIIV